MTAIRKEYGDILGALGPFFVGQSAPFWRADKGRIERLFEIQLENARFIRKPLGGCGLFAGLEKGKFQKKAPKINDLRG